MDVKGVPVKASLTKTRKMSDGNYGSFEVMAMLEVDVEKGVDLDDLFDSLDVSLTAKIAQIVKDDEIRYTGKTQVSTQQAATVATSGPVAGFGPPAGETVAPPAETVEGLENPVPVEVVKFTLALRTDRKYDLALYQMYGQKVGDYPELKYVAEQSAMWTMIGHLVENLSFDVMPVEYEVSWLADWTHGREYTKKDQTKGHYKDLTGLRQR